MKKELPVTTRDVSRLLVLHAEAMAEAIGLIVHVLAKHSPDPDALIDDMAAISEPEPTALPGVALFFRTFNTVMKGGIDPDVH